MLAALVTVLLWSSAFVGIRAAGHGLHPGPLALARMLIATLVLGVVLVVRGEGLPARADRPRIALAGVLWFAAYMVMLNAAERRLDAGTAAMLVNIGPIVIALLAGAVLREGFPRPLLAGCAIAFSGVVVIGGGIPRGDVAGVALALAAALAYAVAVVVQKPALARSSSIQVTWLCCATGAVACLPFAGGLVHDVGTATAGQLAWTVYLGVAATAVAFLTWGYALARTTAGRMGATTYLVPPVVIVLSWLWLDETPPVAAIVGGAICLAGVVVSRRRVGIGLSRTTAPAPSPSGRRRS